MQTVSNNFLFHKFISLKKPFIIKNNIIVENKLKKTVCLTLIILGMFTTIPAFAEDPILISQNDQEVGIGGSYNGVVTDDGRYVIFMSYARNLIEDYNLNSDIFIKDLSTGEIKFWRQHVGWSR